MKTIHSLIEIGASAENVWKILMDFPRYPEWNPFITNIEGEAKIDSKLKVKLHAPELKPVTVKPKVTMTWEQKQFRWLGKTGLPGIFDAEHMFIIEELDPDKVRFHHNEVFRGLLVPMFAETLQKTRHGFELMNEALKKRAETVTDS
ncbi:SRPBCC family protein [candidate division KSB1 bacterium]